MQFSPVTMYQDKDPLRPDPPQGAATPRRHTVSAFDGDLIGVVTQTARVGGLAEELVSHALASLGRGGGAAAADLAHARALRERLRRLERDEA